MMKEKYLAHKMKVKDGGSNDLYNHIHKYVLNYFIFSIALQKT